MSQSIKKDNEFVVNAQIILDGNLHEIKQIPIKTHEPTPIGFYNKIKNDLTDAYKKLHPNSVVAIVILPSA